MWTDTEFKTADPNATRVDRNHMESFRWPTQISAEMVATAVLRPERMGTIDLVPIHPTPPMPMARPRKNTKSSSGRKCFTP
jgi:hypothetical protein